MAHIHSLQLFFWWSRIRFSEQDKGRPNPSGIRWKTRNNSRQSAQACLVFLPWCLSLANRGRKNKRRQKKKKKIPYPQRFSAHRRLKQLALFSTFPHSPEFSDIKVIWNEFKSLKEITQGCNWEKGLCMISIVREFLYCFFPGRADKPWMLITSG